LLASTSDQIGRHDIPASPDIEDTLSGTLDGIDIVLHCCGNGERNRDSPSASLAEFMIS
jgi:hypothetical protein